MEKQRIFSLSKANGDFKVETFRSGGKGGQHQNKTDSGARIVHAASGLSAESRTERSQSLNIKLAFKRLVSKPEFQKWLRIETARRMGLLKDLDKEVDALMDEDNIKTEVRVEGKWTETKNLVN